MSCCRSAEREYSVRLPGGRCRSFKALQGGHTPGHIRPALLDTKQAERDTEWSMTPLGNDAFKWAQAQQGKGEKVQFIVEALCEAMIAIAPEGTPRRKQILEIPYAQLAKLIGRDSSKFLPTK